MRYENPRPTYLNELYHHGIIGQHWGETNGPPYPLGSGTHNRVVRQGRAERKRLKSEYKDSKKNVENTAYQVRIARTNADKAAKKYAKSSVKNSNERSAKAVDARRTKEFWEKEYANALKTYQEKANAAGKKVKYDGSNRSTVLASTRAGSKGLYALLGGLGGLANVARMNRMARNIEESKGFNRNLNQQSQKNYEANKNSSISDYQASLDKAKAAYKEQKAPRHNGSSASKTTKQSGGTSMQRSAATEKNAIMKEMNRRFGNSEQNKEALAELKAELKTTKGTYDKKAGMSTYSTRFGLFDVYYDKNGKIYNVSFND